MMDPNKPLAPGARPDVRLAKRVAELVPCSRREAEQYIEGGWVRVDGKVVEEPQFRVLKQRIELDKNASLMTLPEVTLLLHKPPGYSDGEDDDEDPTPSGKSHPPRAPKALGAPTAQPHHARQR